MLCQRGPTAVFIEILNSTDTGKHLQNLIEDGIRQLDLPEQPQSLYAPFRYAISNGGKRIRPLLTLLGCGLCGDSAERALPAALAIELLHNFTLLHDDIMDRAETRRGAPSVFKKWGTSAAILTGDVMFERALSELQQYGNDGKISKAQYQRINKLFLQGVRTVCEGQALDLEFEQEQHVSLDEYLTMIQAKTAALLSVSLQLGGLVAGADDQVIDQLEELGDELGKAFQIQDDLLDVVGDPSKFGKRRGGDIAEGKKTYLTILALQQGDKEEKNQLQNILHKTAVTDEEIEWVIDLYEEGGIIEQTRQAVKYYYEHAVQILEQFNESPFRDELESILNRLNQRES